jgi:phage terminase large subunit-like protein
MRRTGQYLNFELLTHGNANKVDRVTWALQGRLENNDIVFINGDYIPKVIDQLVNFPDKRVHDDTIDALAYIAQLAIHSYGDDDIDFDDGSWAAHY